ncbi:MAG: SGNH/GDSL hydrolase family protein [Capsulimonadales bacterium]|nr:SGNH/GDSL hydrolase family protein [Capsulimonadales bacterium]
MEWYEGEVQALERQREENPPPPEVVAFYGSSSIRLWSTLADDFPEVPVLNLGFGGSTLTACVHYFERLVPPCHPKVLLCYAGENDIGDGRSVDAIVGSFRELHQKVDRDLGPISFAYLSIKPSPLRWSAIDKIREVNARIRQEIRTRPESLFIDIHTPMLDDHGQPRRELWTEDGIHMSREGYHVWWQVVSAHRRRLGF